MRKTRGYVMHKAGMCIEEISKALRPSHTAVTMSYIGLDAEAVRRSFLEFELLTQWSRHHHGQNLVHKPVA